MSREHEYVTLVNADLNIVDVLPVYAPEAMCVGADLLADLSASQLLAQADLTDCNSPLKIVQIGGDDLFETDEAAGNDYLLDTEAALSPQA